MIDSRSYYRPTMIQATAAAMVMFFIGWVIGLNAVQNPFVNQPKVPEMTRAERVYLDMARMGFVDWQAACVYSIAKDSKSWQVAKAKCTSDFLDKLRDGKPVPDPITPAEIKR